MNDTLVSRDLWMRYTTISGESYVVEHRVWDADRFVEEQKRSHDKVNAQQAEKTGKPCSTAKAEQITQEQYLAEKAAR